MEATMTLEQLISVFGEEVGTQMHKQMNASAGGGNKAPFTFLKKIATHGSELGAFGEFCVGVETEKQADGTRAVTNPGTNLGTSFEFVIVNVSYRYKRWDEVKQRTNVSNIFESLDGIKTAVDVYTGKPLPADKAAKKDDGWKLVRINAGLVRKGAKGAWTSAIWETDGSLYYTLGEVISSQPNGGLLSGISKIVTKLDAKGATQFSVIDVEASSFAALPKDFFEKEKASLSEITTKMGEYRKAAQYTAGSAPQAAAAPAEQAAPAGDADSTEW